MGHINRSLKYAGVQSYLILFFIGGIIAELEKIGHCNINTNINLPIKTFMHYQ